MGNRGRLYAVLGALFAVAGIGLAFGQGSRIAFVNSQEILYQTDQGKEGLAELEQYMNQQRQQFDARNKELTDLQQDYQFKRGSLLGTIKPCIKNRRDLVCGLAYLFSTCLLRFSAV